jgi:hypothetical protein
MALARRLLSCRQHARKGPHKRRIAVISSKGSGSQDASVSHASRIHGPAALREASPQPDAVGGRAASSLAGQVRSFVAIGILSTLAYAGLYLLLRTVSTPVAANAMALILTAIGNTAAATTGTATNLNQQGQPS